jgi:hypothetical protein
MYIQLGFKKVEDQMFGYYLSELQKTMKFEDKKLFILKCRELNKNRINIVHKLTRIKSIDEIERSFQPTKILFDEIYEMLIFKMVSIMF